MLYKYIYQKEKDLAGKFRVWVNTEDQGIVIFKFQADPTEEQVKAECARINEIAPTVSPKLRMLDELDEQIARLNERKEALKLNRLTSNY